MFSPQKMAVYMKHPSIAQDVRQTPFFPQVPRKLDTSIPEVPGEIDWGLLYVEGHRWTMINIIVVCVWMGALAVSLTGLKFPSMSWLILSHMRRTHHLSVHPWG